LAWMLMQQQQHQGRHRMQQQVQQRRHHAPLRAWTGLLPRLNSSSCNSPWLSSSRLW
jgi:hypothetical protein